MAVVQISRIQIRRGQKNTGTGIPQLASGELAWAVDTQELFIGNGSVAEGAPFVGNSKILTDNDNILDLFEQYQYKKNDPTIQTGSDSNYPVLRSVQERLDERVSVAEFGAIGDGSADDTEAIQRAIDQLYLNPATVGLYQGRYRLDIAPGTYNVSSTIYIPSYANISGSGQGRTVINYTGTGSAFEFINDTSTIGNPQGLWNAVSGSSTIGSTTYNNQCKNVSMSGFTLNITNSNTTGFKLNAVRNSVFNDIGITGPWVITAPAENNSIGVAMYALSSLVTCQANRFNRVDIVGLSYGVYAKQDVIGNVFSECLFSIMHMGFSLGIGSDGSSAGQLTGPVGNSISNSSFATITRQGIKVQRGSSNLSSLNRFINVGCDGGGNTGYSGPVVGQIEFDTVGNSSVQDIFDRLSDLSGSNFTKPYVSEIGGKASFANVINKTVDVIQATPTPLRALRLPIADTIGYDVEYIFKSTSHTQMRRGKLLIAVDTTNDGVQLVDEYEYTGTTGEDTNLSFTAELVDSDSSGSKDSIQIYYTETTSGQIGTLTFSYRSLT